MKKLLYANVLSASILLAAILFSGSLIYSARLVVKNLNGGSIAAAAKSQNGTQAQPAGQADVAGRGDAPVLGESNAKVAIYLFSDFQCLFCEKFFSGAMKQIKTDYIDTGKVKLIFRNFPLAFHANAQKAAEAAECANRQGKFWPYHDLLFKNGKSDGTGLAVEDLKKYADQLGLNAGALGFGADKFNQCLDNGEAVDTVKKDQADGSAAGVTGTPVFFINGKKVSGAQPFSVFQTAIEEALK